MQNYEGIIEKKKKKNLDSSNYESVDDGSLP